MRAQQSEACWPCRHRIFGCPRPAIVENDGADDLSADQVVDPENNDVVDLASEQHGIID